MSDPEIYPVPVDLAARAHMDRDAYEAARIAARETPEAYWGEQAKRLDWMTFPTKIKNVSFDKADFHIRWFADGVLNVSANCLDRHLPHRGDQTAIIWEGDDPSDSQTVTYRQLHARGLPHGQCAEGQRRQEGRPGHHLPADDPRGGRRHAGLRADRRGPLGGLRRLLARQPRRPHPGLRLDASSSPPTRACAAARSCR